MVYSLAMAISPVDIKNRIFDRFFLLDNHTKLMAVHGVKCDASSKK
jgi:hypothetical protein